MIGAVEALEDPGEILGGDARARIRDGQGTGIAKTGAAQSHGSRGVAEFHRIVQKIHEHLGQPISIAEDHEAAGSPLIAEVQLRLRREIGISLEDAAGELVQVERFPPELELAGLQTGQIQEVLSQTLQTPSLLVDYLHRPALGGIGGHLIAVREDLAEADQGRQGRLQVVRDIGNELALQLTRAAHLAGHSVEAAREIANLVLTLVLDALVVVAARHFLRGLCNGLDGPSDRTHDEQHYQHGHQESEDACPGKLRHQAAERALIDASGRLGHDDCPHEQRRSGVLHERRTYEGSIGGGEGRRARGLVVRAPAWEAVRVLHLLAAAGHVEPAEHDGLARSGGNVVQRAAVRLRIETYQPRARSGIDRHLVAIVGEQNPEVVRFGQVGQPAAQSRHGVALPLRGVERALRLGKAVQVLLDLREDGRRRRKEVGLHLSGVRSTDLTPKGGSGEDRAEQQDAHECYEEPAAQAGKAWEREATAHRISRSAEPRTYSLRPKPC